MRPDSKTFTIDVRRLHVLRELADHGTVAATAAAMHLTPSAISQQIAALSREAGVALLERCGRGVVLTGGARILLTHADAVSAQIERARADLAAHAQARSGRLVVGAFATAITTVLAPLVQRWHTRRPGVDVHVVEIEGRDALAALRRGEVDAAVVMDWRDAPSADDARCARRALPGDPLDLLVPSDHRLAVADGEAVHLAELARERWVTGLSGPCQEVVLDACAAAGFTPITPRRSGDWTAVAALVAAGAGLALVPRMALATSTVGTVRRELAPPRPTRSLSLLTRAGSTSSPLLTALTEDLTSPPDHAPTTLVVITP